MNQCKLCKYNFKDRKNLINHFLLKKIPCIKDIKKWNKEKEYFLKLQEIKFDKYQSEFINDKLIDSKLLGVPGGGKTRCIIEKIKKLFDQHDQYLILTFSKRARYDFLKKGKEISKKLFNLKNVRTLHSLAGYIVTSISDRNSSCLETVIIAALNLLDQEKDKVKNLDNLKKIEAIFVDEAQDISDKQYQFIINLKSIINCKLIMVGDPNQNIYQFQGGSDRFLLEYQGKEYKLKNNYRSSREIINFVNSISPHGSKMVSNTRKKNDKVIIFEGGVEQIELNLMKFLKETNFDYSQIAIIGPVKRCNVKDNSYMNIGLSLITNLLSKKKINFIKHYSDGSDKNDSSQMKLKDGHLNLFTIHGSKGLEFEVVFLLNYHFSTFGIRPSIDDYNIFKYMWYVGASRAKQKLIIYKLKDKNIWPLTKNIDRKLLNLNFRPSYPKLKFQKQRKELQFCVTKYLEDLKPVQLYQYQEMFKFEVEEEIIFTIKNKKIFEYKDFNKLYGCFIEIVFEYYYLFWKHELEKDNLFTRIKYQLDNTLIIPIKFKIPYTSLLSKLNIDSDKIIKLERLHHYKNFYNESELNLYKFIEDKMNHNMDKAFYISLENKVMKKESKKIIKILDQFIENYKLEEMDKLFEIVLYKYQIQNESAYLLDYDFTFHLESLRVIIEQIKEFCKNESKKTFKFQHSTMHKKFPIVGILDILNQQDKEIIDVKFTKRFNIKQAYQLLLYYNNVVPSWGEDYKLIIYNFYTGKKYHVKFEKKSNNYDFLKLLCDNTKTKLTNMIFCYDLETTGLDISKLQIIERYFEEYHLKFSPSNGLIKIKGKIPIEIQVLTGIDNKMVKKGDHPQIFINEIREIFNYCEYPKFMAHNGSTFDHKILFTRMPNFLSSSDQLLDSKYIIRMLSKVDTLKLSLGDIYKKITKKELINCHRAKDDVSMMIEILKKLNY